MKNKALVVGSTGLVGSHFADIYKEDVITPDLSELDITKRESVFEYFKKNDGHFDYVINFAAYTNVVGAEGQRNNESADAWFLNVKGAENIAEASKEYKKSLIHISTDFIFPGSKDNKGPYDESAVPSSESSEITWYGWTKLMGEQEILRIKPDSTIVRISYPFRAHYDQKADFLHKILDLYDNGTLYPMFDDQFLTPTFIHDLSPILAKIIELKLIGIYHVTSPEVTTPYDFACDVLKIFRGVENVVKRSSIVPYIEKSGMKTPIYGGLKSEKVQAATGIKLLTYKEALHLLKKNKK